MTDLSALPCPFCGSNPILTAAGYGNVHCVSSDCFGPRITAEYLVDALKQWNTRALGRDTWQGDLAVAVEAEVNHAQGWQDISTAPKDGTVVDLWSGVRLPNCRWESASYAYYGIPWGWQNSSYGRIINATHWMPLPAPPSSVTLSTKRCGFCDGPLPCLTHSQSLPSTTRASPTEDGHYEGTEDDLIARTKS